MTGSNKGDEKSRLGTVFFVAIQKKKDQTHVNTYQPIYLFIYLFI
jgi:hypothetical protein